MTKPVYFVYTKSIGLYLNFLSFVHPEKAMQIAYSLFAEPRKGRLIKSSLPEILKEAEIENFHFKNQKFKSYIWKGNQTVIILVHGWESNSLRWQKLLPYLQETGSTIIAIDAPAHGLSSGNKFDIPKYAAYINIVAKKYNPKYLIGHSLGGKTCLYYQYFYKNKNIEKIVTLGSPSDFKILLNKYIKLLSLNTNIKKSLEVQYRKIFRSSLTFFSAKHFASKINTRGLIAHDISDSVVAYEEGKKIASVWKDSIFIETKGLGHSMHDEDLYQKITQFLFEVIRPKIG
jgi:triacylglycerol esterase/lipase EstA (alpha/beta hydrolase family)